MLHFINDDHLFENNSETHYRYHTQLDLAQYPQVHNFYEIVAVTSGVLHMQLCGQKLSLRPGQLVFIRPGDVHSKSGENTEHINLAFPSHTLEALFHYLKNNPAKEELLSSPTPPGPFSLDDSQFQRLRQRLQFLNTIDYKNWQFMRTCLRTILFEIMTDYIVPSFLSSFPVTSSEKSQYPSWLTDALKEWQTSEHRQEGLDFFCRHTGMTKEYICRTFKRCFNQTPTAYLNQQRLNYAVNLLLHSDYPIIDIAYDSGFKSLSRFYHIFQQTHGVSPKQFRTRQNMW